MYPVVGNQFKFQQKNKFLKDFFKFMKIERSMSDCARNRALELFDIKYWIKRHEEVFENFLN